MNNISKYVKYETIITAVAGDEHAINSILAHYESYINKLSIRKFINELGEESFVTDTYLADILNNHVITAILKFKPMFRKIK